MAEDTGRLQGLGDIDVTGGVTYLDCFVSVPASHAQSEHFGHPGRGNCMFSTETETWACFCEEFVELGVPGYGAMVGGVPYYGEARGCDEHGDPECQECVL